jgi:hypothetical protein
VPKPGQARGVYENNKIAMKLRTLAPLFTLTIIFGWKAEAQTYDTNNVVVHTFAGSGFSGYLDGQGTQTMFNNPKQVVADTFSNLFVLDYGSPGFGYQSRIRKITPDGTVSTFASMGNAYCGSMSIDHSNALWIATTSGLLRVGSDASVSGMNWNGVAVLGVCVDSGNNIYFSDPDGNKIYR